MRTDLSPLFRSSIGFDRMFALLDEAATRSNWPPYDVLRHGEDGYRIVMALAGFSRDEITLTERPNLLVVEAARKSGAPADEGVYLHKGIATREFLHRFQLADHVKVAGAVLRDGLLTIDLQREVPEALKPRSIEIQGASDASDASRPKLSAAA